MSIAKSERQDHVCERPAATPLNEAAWQAWVLKGRVQEERSYAARIKAIKWISLVGLLLAAATGCWPDRGPYADVVRFAVMFTAMTLMIHACNWRHYAFAAVFGAMALLYNPVGPVLSSSGDWQRFVFVATAVPIAASLTWRRAKIVPNA